MFNEAVNIIATDYKIRRITICENPLICGYLFLLSSFLFNETVNIIATDYKIRRITICENPLI